MLACVVLVGALALPAGGLGVELCMWKRATHLPCPGCGMTRALRAAGHADMAAAVRFNPFGLVLLPWAMVAASTLAWPRRGRDAVDAWLARHERGVLRGCAILLAAFLAHGLARIPLVGLGLWPRI